MKRGLDRNRNERGVALLFSLGIIVFFAMLGAAYIGYMNNAYDAARFEVNQSRVRGVAEAGIHAAIAEIQSALADGGQPASVYTFEPAVYRHEQAGRVAYAQKEVTVSVADEMARVNLNHAPQAVLEALGFEAEAAAAMVKSRPRAAGKGRFLNTVDDMVARELVTQRAHYDLREAGTLNDLTVYTAIDPASPKGFVNINTASPRVLGAIVAVDETEAETIAGKRPFASWEDVLTGVGREPTTFNVRHTQIGSRNMPEALTLSSRCFRLTAEATVDFPGLRRSLKSATEAVVIFDENGHARVRFWNTRPTERSD